MLPTRIAAVRFLNTAPLVAGLHKLEGLTLVPTVPSRIAEMVAGGQADIGLCSIVDAARFPLALLPVGQIGCDGPTLTVRLFSSTRWESVTRLHADTDSHTSVALARLILAKRFGAHPEVIDFDARERVENGRSPRENEHDWPDTVLLIGDKVVTDHPPPARYPHQLDLGEQWKLLTGLPFVYAMWMCRAADADTPRVRHAATLLDRQLRHNLTRLDWIVSEHAPGARWPLDLARTYLAELLRFEVGEQERLAVDHFLSEAAAARLIPHQHAAWADPLAAPLR